MVPLAVSLLVASAAAAIMEGDIAVDSGLEETAARDAFVRDSSYLWPEGRVYFRSHCLMVTNVTNGVRVQLSALG